MVMVSTLSSQLAASATTKVWLALKQQPTPVETSTTQLTLTVFPCMQNSTPDHSWLGTSMVPVEQAAAAPPPGTLLFNSDCEGTSQTPVYHQCSWV